MLEFSYCECECGTRFRVMLGTNIDEKGSMLAAYAHYVTCAVAFEKAPQLIVEMAATLELRGWSLPINVPVKK